jgi:uncharacterized protein (TIGR02145 family)
MKTIMKTIFKTTTLLLLLVNSCVYGQRGIGTNTPNASAILELASTTKGFLLPRLTSAQRGAISNPVAGLTVYCTDCIVDSSTGQISFYDGSNWTFSALTTVPNAPTIGAVTAGNSQATVAYTAPTNNGGSGIFSYTAKSNPGNVTGTLSQSGSGSIDVVGLYNGTDYTFTVTANNANGASLASDASGIVTPEATVPDAPTNVIATGGNAQATISYTAPDFDGGSAITSYTATSNPDGFTGTLSQSGSGSITVVGLTNYTEYTFSVTAKNTKGDSAATVSNAVTPPSFPSAPTIVTVTAGSGQAKVAYTAPSNNGGSPITSYTATASSTAPDVDVTLSQEGSGTIIVGGLTNGTDYSFTVSATNVNGTGVASAPSGGVTPSVVDPSYVYSNDSGGVYTFSSHNLGADTSLDPHTPVEGLNGDYYQWGRYAPAANVNAVISTWGSQGGTSVNGNWTPGTKETEDPCPAGFRVPSKVEWTAVNSYNTVSRTGIPWSTGATVFGNALHYGPDGSIKTLTLPATGFRSSTIGVLYYRGSLGYYRSSTENGGNAYSLFFDSSNVDPAKDNPRANGFSVRCIAE